MKTLIFSIGLNGYDIGYRSCLDSQRDYAMRIGADYRVATRPTVEDPALAAWLKVPLLLRAISSGYEKVAYIDADCRVSEQAPDFRTEMEAVDGKVCMTLGRTERLNSGVIFASRSESSSTFLSRVLNSILEDVPAEDRANLRFENGNIIYVNGRYGGVHVLSRLWNNSSDPDLEDYIRHFTGPLKSTLKAPTLDRVRYRLRKVTLPRSRPAPERRSMAFKQKLEWLTETVWADFVSGSAS